MIVVIVLLGIGLLAAIGFIFWLLEVLKNTLDITETAMDMVQGKDIQSADVAYDGQYYPGTVILKMMYNAPQRMVVTDFSAYEENKIIMFTFYEPDSFFNHIKRVNKSFLDNLDIVNEEDIPDEIIQHINKPTILKNMVVYSPMKGLWTWKSQE